MNRILCLFHNLFRRRKFESDLRDELDAYLEMLVEEKIATGLSPAKARRAAKVELGSMESVKEAVRSVSAGDLLRQLWQDVQYAVRMLKKQPGVVVIAVLTIALGIGVNASIFSILNSLLLRPLPAPDADSLVSLYQKVSSTKNRAVIGGQYRFSYPEYVGYRDQNRVLNGLAAYHPEVRVLVDDQAQEAEAQVVSCNYFSVLQAKIALGRGFLDADCNLDGSTNVLVLSDALWRHQFAGDPGIVGRTVRINRIPFTIVGVAAPGFGGANLVSAALWSPISAMKALSGAEMDLNYAGNDVYWLELIGRRREGVSLPELRANLELIAREFDRQTPGLQREVSATASFLIGAPSQRPSALAAGAVILIAVSMVLMIACANLANLMLARSIARSQEISMRMALGASRNRVVRQLLTESVFLASIGGALGIVFAWWSGDILMHVLLSHLPSSARVPLQIAVHADLYVIGYAFLLTLVTGAAFGLLPAFRATRPDLNSLLRQESKSLFGRRRGFGRSLLVAGQLAFCMVLLIASGLLVRALLHAQTADPGFTMRGVAVVSYDLGRAGYTNAQAAVFNTELIDRLHPLPGVRQLALASGSPLGTRHFFAMFQVPGQMQALPLPYLEVSPDFFSVVQVPILRGRSFSREELTRDSNAVIVSESLARSLWAGEEPLGKVLQQGSANGGKTNLEVIGVARDADVGELGDRDHRFIYLPPYQHDQLMVQTALVRYGGDYSALSNTLRSAFKSMDPALKLDVTRLEDNLGPYKAISSITAGIAGALGCLALGLAMIGLYGTVAYGVSCRTREIGLRVAMGAKPANVLSLLVRQAMRPVILGSLAGVGLCAAVSKILSGLLFGISPYDAVAYSVVPALLVAIALLAAWIPARRALKVDPVVALREN